MPVSCPGAGMQAPVLCRAASDLYCWDVSPASAAIVRAVSVSLLSLSCCSLSDAWHGWVWSAPYCLGIYKYVNISLLLPCPYNAGSLAKVAVLTELTSAGTSHLSLGISWSLIGKVCLEEPC